MDGDDAVGGVHDEELGVIESGDDEVVFFPFSSGGGDGFGVEAFDEGEGIAEVSALGAEGGDEDGAAFGYLGFEEGGGVFFWCDEEGLEAFVFGDLFELGDGVSVRGLGRVFGEELGFGEGDVPVLADGGEGGGAACGLVGLEDGVEFGVGEVLVFFIEGGAGSGAGILLAGGEEGERGEGCEKRC